jgi:hypothetical protein
MLRRLEYMRCTGFRGVRTQSLVIIGGDEVMDYRWVRMLAVFLGVIGLAGLALGCGSSGGNGTSDVQRVSLSPPITSLAKAYARAVNLRRADVPGMIEGGAEGGIADGVPLGAPTDRCMGGLGRSGQADAPIDSAFFISSRHPISEHDFQGLAKAMRAPGARRVYSSVDVMRSEALARREVAGLGTARLRVCLMNHYETLRGSAYGQPLYSDVKVYPLPSGLAGPGIAGLRITGTVARPRHTREAFFSDLVAAPEGRSVVALRVNAGRRPFPVRSERHLLLLLETRARATRFA